MSEKLADILLWIVAVWAGLGAVGFVIAVIAHIIAWVQMLVLWIRRRRR